MKRNFYLPDDDDETMALKKRFLNFNTFARPLLLAVFGLVLWILEARKLAIGMWLFGGISLCIFVAFYLVRNHIKLFAAITLYFYVLFSFVGVLVFGGILYSGGVVFVGLAGVLLSISFFRTKQSRIIFIVYLLTLIIEALLQPFLTPLPEITPAINLTLFVLHILVIAIIMFSTISYYIEQSIQAKNKEADRLKELDTLKTQFYDNITHEFRTPLTVILGMTDQISEKPKEHFRIGLQLIRQNGIRLLHLVNQMLDLSKLEAESMPIHLIQKDILKYLRYISEPFERITEEKNIEFHFLTDFDEIEMDFDPEKIESLVGNLLSNAIKYSPEDSDIYFKIEIAEKVEQQEGQTFTLFSDQLMNGSGKKLRLEIRDTGQGIPSDKIGIIFDRFYQIDHKITGQVEGSGIGLSLVKELVKLMDGNLLVKSSPGKGTTFSVYLPITNNAPQEELEESSLKDEPSQFYLNENEELSEKWHSGQNLHRLLVIEDNPDVVQYIRSILEREYQIEVANNGCEGIEKALEIIPDIIISDIMMPEKDGFEVCQVLKNDIRTSHVPIVILTAKADMESKITGLEYGADAYLFKPFNSKELRVRLQKLIELRGKLKVKYHLMSIDPSPVEIPHNPDVVFINKLKKVMIDNLDNEDFDNNQLCNALGISRVQLFRKLKALTGQSASQFMRSFRLNKAKAILLSSHLNVSEVAYDVGFKDPAYFTRAFTKEFGITPSSLRTDQ